MSEIVPIPAEAEQALLILKQTFGHSLLAAYLHGSAVAGGLHPNSDVDVLAVIDQPTTHAARAQLTTELMKISGHPGRGDIMRPIELIVFHRDDLASPAYPARSEFVYGEWLREAFEAGEVPEPGSDPELTVLLAQARHEAKVLTGPHPAQLLPIIPKADLHRAMGDALPALLDTLEGDERNVLLTLARMWRTLTTGEFVSKDAAAEWAIPRLPAAAAKMVSYARDGYLGSMEIDWSAYRKETRRAARDLSKRVETLL
ncbi:aminoglycoside adenylyltransferase family protein [Mesorhizobium sp. RMAD-H1]|uniref:aminoglycoside adenylyltransferase family protein n=1 Tax=Mesorhizobium sp. RMAD-H1 TaxID=2587065 RepID=UPI0016077AC5|nr:aminoglycoside adenylyltransferase family protein [Mesorhizobium sp. RMAD-H1]MBB2971499.1 streptomycin 3'-adenylyltransferase [Mesorhizobium sp. RMAD-H1]